MYPFEEIEIDSDLFSAEPAALSEEELISLRDRAESAIEQLDEVEPENMNSEEYDKWAELHEFLEDILEDAEDRLG